MYVAELDIEHHTGVCESEVSKEESLKQHLKQKKCQQVPQHQ